MPRGLVGVELPFETNVGRLRHAVGDHGDIEDQRFTIGNRRFADVVDRLDFTQVRESRA